MAYAGACQALEELRTKYYDNFDKEILIKSITGTSAGGIVGLAVSTGISYQEIKKILENMREIPKKRKRFLGSPDYGRYKDKMQELEVTV